jgi:alkanesulfonate monooxygenase
MAGRKLVLSAILSTVNAWRHPAWDPAGIYKLKFYKELAQIAERGKLDMIFFGDALSLPGQARGGAIEEYAITRGIEPMTLIAALSAATEHIGFIGTLNTSYLSPYAIARKLATLYLLSGGRAAWNAVTATTYKDDHNFRPLPPLSQNERYERTDEFIHLVRELLGSWVDEYPQSLRFSGKWFDAKEPLNVRMPLNDQPLVIQAGRSEQFQLQAARTADAVFTTFSSLEEGKQFYQRVKHEMRRIGRAGHELKILPGLRPILGETIEEARNKAAYLQSLIHPAVSIQALSASLHMDLSQHDPNAPLPEHVPAEVTLTKDEAAYREQVAELARSQQLSILELSKKLIDTRGHLSFVGTPGQLADYMEQWLEEKGADGFNIMLPYLPGGLRDFVDLAVPELQRRGLFRQAYEGRTLRENMGL